MKQDIFYWLEKYYERFGDYFPTENFSSSEDEMVEEIKRCIKLGATVEELSLNPPGVLY